MCLCNLAEAFRFESKFKLFYSQTARAMFGLKCFYSDENHKKKLEIIMRQMCQIIDVIHIMRANSSLIIFQTGAAQFSSSLLEHLHHMGFAFRPHFHLKKKWYQLIQGCECVCACVCAVCTLRLRIKLVGIRCAAMKMLLYATINIQLVIAFRCKKHHPE